MPNEDQTRGKVKEVGGKLTGDDQLEAEGKAEKKKGDAKEKFEDAKDTVRGGFEAAKDKISGKD